VWSLRTVQFPPEPRGEVVAAVPVDPVVGLGEHVDHPLDSGGEAPDLRFARVGFAVAEWFAGLAVPGG